MCTGVCFAMLEPYYTILDTVCPPPLWEALQGAPFPDQQVQEQLHPCGCHPTALCTTVIAPHPPPPPSRCDCTAPLHPGLTATHPPPATEHLHQNVFFTTYYCINRTYTIHYLLNIILLIPLSLHLTYYHH